MSRGESDPWPPYLETRLEIGPPPHATVAHFSTAVLEGALKGCWHVITAFNPSGAEWTDGQNRAAHERLRDALAELQVTFQRSLGTTPDGRWPEDGFAVAGLTRAQAIDLGRRFGQHAIFEIDAASGRLLDCDSGLEVADVPWRAPHQ